MTREELDFIGAMNMCDDISDDAYKKIVCHCEWQEPCEDCVSRKEVEKLCYKFLSKSTDNNVAFFEHLIELPPVEPTSNLDKIKADIENLETYYDNGDFGIEEPMYIVQDVLDIINKYRGGVKC